MSKCASNLHHETVQYEHHSDLVSTSPIEVFTLKTFSIGRVSTVEAENCMCCLK